MLSRVVVLNARIPGTKMDEILELDAVGQAELVKRREVIPLELVNAAIARM